MHPYWPGSVSSHGGPDPHSLKGQGIGVPMPPPSIHKTDEETGSLTCDATYVDHITIDGQTKISALDDFTYISEDSPPSLPHEEAQQARESYQSKALLWSSIRRKVCCSLLVMGGLIASVAFLLQSSGETHTNDAVIASSISNVTTNGSENQDFLSPAPYGNDNINDFFLNNNNDPSREPGNGVQIGIDIPQGPDATVIGNRPPPQGDGHGCKDRGDPDQQGISVMLRGIRGGEGCHDHLSQAASSSSSHLPSQVASSSQSQSSFHPSQASTHSPTDRPSKVASSTPSQSSFHPSQAPSNNPPSRPPSFAPTPEPTKDPTLAPLAVLSSAPSNAPPTEAPTEEPTRAPMDRPTVSPPDQRNGNNENGNSNNQESENNDNTDGNGSGRDDNRNGRENSNNNDANGGGRDNNDGNGGDRNNDDNGRGNNENNVGNGGGRDNNDNGRGNNNGGGRDNNNNRGDGGGNRGGGGGGRGGGRGG